MNFYDVLAAEKWGGGIPTINFFDLLFTQSISGKQWQVYEGTLPATLNANGDNMRQYQIYGADGGVGDRTVNLFDKNAKNPGNGFVNDKYLSEDGAENYSSDYYISEYMPITSGENYALCNAAPLSMYIAICFYTAEKSYIKGVPYAVYYMDDTLCVTAPANAAYARATVSKLSTNVSFYPYTTQLEVGTYVYVPFGYEVDISTEKPIIYGFHINPNDPNPYTAVTYLEDAVGKTPAAMGNTAFNYGSWENAFFMPKPCMVRYDGHVEYYLDPNDYSKKSDGTASHVNDLTFGGNAMMEFPLIWYKFVQGVADGEGYFYVSNKKVDNTYKCWSNMDCDGNIIEHFYMPIYNGCTYDGKMRSISGLQLSPWSTTAYSSSSTYAVGSKVNYNGRMWKCITAVETAEAFDPEKWEQFAFNGNAAGTEDINYAKANNTTEKTEWYIDQWCDRVLINGLLVLISKSIDTRGKFGRGIDSGSQATKESYITGSLNDKGLFYGSTATGTTAVKVFGMENWWALVWRRTAGLIGGANNTYLYKLTASTADGSTASAYNTNGSGYLSTNDKPTSNNYVKQMKFGAWGWLPFEVGAYSTQYYKNYYYNGTGFALVGGSSSNGAICGAFSADLSRAVSNRYWGGGAAPSCKPCRVGNLNKNLEATTVTPIYIGDEPLWAVNNYADYTDYQKQKIVRAIKKYVLTGEENWEEITGVYASRKYFRWVFAPVNYCIRHVCISSHFTQTNITTATTTVGFDVFDSSTAGGEVLAIRPSGVQSTTLEDFKAWLAEQYAAGTPVTVWCALTTAEEIDPPVTLPALPTVEGTTIVDYAGQSVAPEKVLLEYAKGGN